MSDKCFLMVRSEPLDPRMLPDYHQWYEDHIQQLLGVKGVRRARRFESISGDMRYAALYEMDNPGIFESPAYRAVGRFGVMEPHVRFTRNVYREIPIVGFADRFRAENSGENPK